MHIVYVTSEFVTEDKAGGLASYLANISRIMSSHGHQVTIVTLSLRNDDRIEWGNGIVVERVRRVRNSGLVPLRIILQSKDLKKRVLKVQQDRPIDLIQYASYEAVGFSRVKGIPSAVRISSDPVCWRMLKYYDCTEEDLNHPAFTDRLEYQAEKRCGAVFGPSTATGRIIERWTGVKVSMIESPFYPYAKEEDAAVYDEKLAGKKYYLSHSSMSCLKGTHTIAEAIPAMAEADPEAYYVFAGSDHGIWYKDGRNIPAVEYIQDHAGQYRDRVIFLGTLERKYLYPIIRHAYACLMPSRMDNMPNTCIEAMAMGKIVVGTEGASYEQMIHDGGSGFLIPRDDPAALADAVRRINQLSASEYEAMGRAAQKVTARFDPEKAYQNLMRYYQALCRC